MVSQMVLTHKHRLDILGSQKSNFLSFNVDGYLFWARSRAFRVDFHMKNLTRKVLNQLIASVKLDWLASWVACDPLKEQ